jgi:hypothetical protein
LVLGFLHGERSEFADDVSETAVGPIFTGRSGFRNFVSKFTSHTVHKPLKPKKIYSFHGESLKSRKNFVSGWVREKKYMKKI